MEKKNAIREVLKLYHDNGFKLFPLQRNSKAPSVEWKNIDYTEDSIIKLLDQGYNYGASIPEDIIVIDVDRHGDNDGFKVLDQFVNDFNHTFKVITPSGGAHIFYKVDQEYKRTVGLYKGIDLLTNGYVVGAGSVINGKIYRAVNTGPINKANQYVLDFVKFAKTDSKREDLESEQLSDHVRTILDGERNDRLFKLAVKLHNQGLNDETVLKAVWSENNIICQNPLTQSEIKSLVKSACRYETEEDQEEKKTKHLISDMITLSTVKPKPIEWLIDDLIPKGCTTLIGADGGTGKSYFWMSLFASLSAGKPYFFSEETPEPNKVMFFSSEDQLETVIVPRLIRMGADLNNIITISEESESFNDITFNSKHLEELIKHYRPAVVCFDPIQSFVGNDINMGSQNQMRNMLQPLKRLEKMYDVTFLIICHTNKRNAFSPRDRLSNSGDIWDIARSVIMMGKTLDGNIFVSKEKGNYSKQNHYSFIYTIQDGKPEYLMASDKTYYDFMYEQANHTPEGEEKRSSKKDTAKDLIIRELQETFTKSMLSSVLIERVVECGVAKATYNMAMAELTKDRVIKKDKKPEGWYTILVKTDTDNGDKNLRL